MILGFPFVSTGVRKRKGGYTWKRMEGVAIAGRIGDISLCIYTLLSSPLVG